MQPIKLLRGDTLVEVLFSITVFAIVAVITINLMNNGIYTAQKSLEITMARNEIDAQAEALRFIHTNYLAERNFADNQYRDLWETVIKYARAPSYNLARSFNDIDNCTEAYPGTGMRTDYQDIASLRAFILNTRLIQPKSIVGASGTSLDDIIVNVDSARLVESPLYARIIYGSSTGSSVDGKLKEQSEYRDIVVAEGIWIIAVKSEEEVNKQPEFYDFYIRTCWHSVGRRVPSTIGTIVRLYNPEIFKGQL